jgi:hypothetical protein
MRHCARLSVEVGGQNTEHSFRITSDILARLLFSNIIKFQRAIAPKCDCF